MKDSDFDYLVKVDADGVCLLCKGDRFVYVEDSYMTDVVKVRCSYCNSKEQDNDVINDRS